MRIMPNQIPAHSTAGEAWQWAMKIIDRYGNKVITEDRQITKEVKDLQIQILSPGDGWPVLGSGWDMPALNEYVNREILSPNMPDGFRYTYGQRLFAYPIEGRTINQIDDYVIKKLRQERTTRRAKASIWHPVLDLFEKSTPCLQDVTFLNRDCLLSLTADFRSWDVGMAAIENMYGLWRLLDYVSNGAEMQSGNLTIRAVSAHIYQV